MKSFEPPVATNEAMTRADPKAKTQRDRTEKRAAGMETNRREETRKHMANSSQRARELTQYTVYKASRGADASNRIVPSSHIEVNIF